MFKIKFLYHGSSNSSLNILVPKAITVRDSKEGLVVFATQARARASLFIVPSDDSWTNKSCFNGVNYHLIADKDRFLKLDKGGAIYTLNSDDFTTNSKAKEWVSTIPVKPIGKEVFKSGIDAMNKYGVKVIYCDFEFLQKYQELISKDKVNEALKVLKDLEK